MKQKLTDKQIKSMVANAKKLVKMEKQIRREMDRTYGALYDECERFEDRWYYLGQLDHPTPKQKKELREVESRIDKLDAAAGRVGDMTW